MSIDQIRTKGSEKAKSSFIRVELRIFRFSVFAFLLDLSSSKYRRGEQINRN